LIYGALATLPAIEEQTMTNKGISQIRVPVPARMRHLPTDPMHGNLPVLYFIGMVRDASGELQLSCRHEIEVRP
jgi:hypothetical protein